MESRARKKNPRPVAYFAPPVGRRAARKKKSRSRLQIFRQNTPGACRNQKGGVRGRKPPVPGTVEGHYFGKMGKHRHGSEPNHHLNVELETDNQSRLHLHIDKGLGDRRGTSRLPVVDRATVLLRRDTRLRRHFGGRLQDGGGFNSKWHTSQGSMHTSADQFSTQREASKNIILTWRLSRSTR